MNSIEKGNYGYLKKYKRNKLIAVISFVIMIVFIVVTVYLMFGDTKRVAIIFAILLALPLSKFFTAYIICAKFKSLTEADYNTIMEKSSDCFKELSFDISISRYEGIKFYQSMLIKNGKIYAFVYDNNFTVNKKDYEAWIKNAISDTKYDYKVFVTDKLNEFIKKINSVSEPNHKNMLIDKHIKELIYEKGV